MEKSLTREKLAEILVKGDQKENSILYKLLNNGEFTTLNINDSLVYELVQSSVDININSLKMYFQIDEKNNNGHVALFDFILPAIDEKTSKGPVAIFDFTLPAKFVKKLYDNLYDNLPKTTLQLVDPDTLESKKKFDKHYDDYHISHSLDTFLLSVTCKFNHDRTLKQITIDTINLSYLLARHSTFANLKPIF